MVSTNAQRKRNSPAHAIDELLKRERALFLVRDGNAASDEHNSSKALPLLRIPEPLSTIIDVSEHTLRARMISPIIAKDLH